MNEQAYQSKLIKTFSEEGFFVIKLILCNMSGLPDLLLLKPPSGANAPEIRFVEVKSARGRLSKIQDYRHAQLRRLGFEVEVMKAPQDGRRAAAGRRGAAQGPSRPAGPS